MQLPDHLKLAIEKILKGIRSDELAGFSQQLSKRYRENKKISDPHMREMGDYLAYLTTRLPATFGAICRVLQEARARLPDTLQINSLLDVGAGPGTAFFAADEVFNIQQASLVEKEPGLIALGKSLTDQRCLWLEQDLQAKNNFEKHDLVTMSYALGELAEETWQALLESLWMATEKILVIVEPGTPAGFKRILAARTILQSLGGMLVAPCPHQNACPLQNISDWCHFSQRIERSSHHRKSKNAELNYEDEKFSYIVFSKLHFSVSENAARILYHPQKHSGHVELSLCTQTGVANKIISRKQKTLYREVKKAKWGDIVKTDN